MREYAKKAKNQSHTLDSNPKASRQASIDVILQRYKERNIQRYAEDEELLQGKFGTVQRKEIDEDELLQGKFGSVPISEQKTMQREKKSNNTGLPDNLKIGIENLSGYNLDDVKVHYNSDKPTQLNALAYAQGTDIHVAPGQEQHLAHEAWHVVQQKQGRVQPTMQMQGLNMNDNGVLEKEADEVKSSIQKTQFQYASDKFKVGSLLTEKPYIIQRITDEKLTEISGKIKEKIDSGTLPDKGVNLWELKIGDKILYLLGTSHGVELNKMGGKESALLSFLINFLQTTEFSQVFTEINLSENGEMRDLSYQSDVFEKIQKRKPLEQVLQDDTKKEREKLVAKGKINNILNPYYTTRLDPAYAALATLRTEGRKIPYKFLETEETRTQAYITNGIDMELTKSTESPERVIYHDPNYKITHKPTDPISSEETIIQGNQKALFQEAYIEKKDKRDIANCEERNSQWMAKEEALQDKTLWIIGAAHLPGLIVRFESLGWNAAHKIS